jgi:hypothetical protein
MVIIEAQENSLIQIWMPNMNNRSLEKEMSKTVGEKVTLVDKSEPLILHKEK